MVISRQKGARVVPSCCVSPMCLLAIFDRRGRFCHPYLYVTGLVLLVQMSPGRGHTSMGTLSE
jgi:hypothetical protein